VRWNWKYALEFGNSSSNLKRIWFSFGLNVGLIFYPDFQKKIEHCSKYNFIFFHLHPKMSLIFTYIKADLLIKKKKLGDYVATKVEKR
jgi:hypothetical protein